MAADVYVFLNDNDTFSPITGATILVEDHENFEQYDLQKLFAAITPEQREAARITDVNEDCIDALG